MKAFSKSSVVLFILIFFVFQSCKKNEPGTDPALYSLKFSRKALDYVNLTIGKFFIYRDSATSLLDSVIVTNSTLEDKYNSSTTPIYGGFYPAFNHENFSLILTKYVGSISQSEWFNGEAKLWLQLPASSTDTAAVNLGTKDQYANTYTTFNLGENDQPNYSVIVEGITYNNVVRTIYDRGLDINHPDYLKEAYYWAKGIGIIKRETIVTGGSVKTSLLLRYN